MRSTLLILLVAFIAACNKPAVPVDTAAHAHQPVDTEIKPIPLAHTNTFSVYESGGYKVVELKAPVVTWSGTAQGDDLSARIVLVPEGQPLPVLSGKLSDAAVIRTPVKRIATNYAFLEAIVSELGLEDRLVAVGGVKSYNDDIRARVKSGDIAQIGYGWHKPPNMDPLLNARPDVLLMVMGSLSHAGHMDRINALGIPVVPVFFEAEINYMGPVDYVRLVGMMTGKEQEAENFVSKVAANVEHLKSLVRSAPRKKVLSSWYSGGERWMVTVRNADNALIEDAGGINPMAQPDDIHIDDFVQMSSETLLQEARDIDCWIIRDSHSQPFNDTKFLRNFKAWREGCLFAADGSRHPEIDAFDIYATGQIRPDLILQDLIQMLYPDLLKAPYRYVQPDNQTPRS